MQTIIVDGTTYKVKFDRDPIELAKLARKPYRPKKPKDIRKFPTYTPAVVYAGRVDGRVYKAVRQPEQFAGGSVRWRKL